MFSPVATSSHTIFVFFSRFFFPPFVFECRFFFSLFFCLHCNFLLTLFGSCVGLLPYSFCSIYMCTGYRPRVKMLDPPHGLCSQVAGSSFACIIIFRFFSFSSVVFSPVCVRISRFSFFFPCNFMLLFFCSCLGFPSLFFFICNILGYKVNILSCIICV